MFKIRASRAVRLLDEHLLEQARSELEQMSKCLIDQQSIVICHGDIYAEREGDRSIYLRLAHEK